MASDANALVDSNVLVDIFTDDPEWGSWSSAALADAKDAGAVLINPVIYAELSIRFESAELLDAALDALEVERAALPYLAGFSAGRAFLAYRRLKGTRTSPLPDFYIGAHAETHGLQLLTRDASRYATYFPSVRLIAP